MSLSISAVLSFQREPDQPAANWMCGRLCKRSGLYQGVYTLRHHWFIWEIRFSKNWCSDELRRWYW